MKILFEVKNKIVVHLDHCFLYIYMFVWSVMLCWCELKQRVVYTFFSFSLFSHIFVKKIPRQKKQQQQRTSLDEGVIKKTKSTVNVSSFKLKNRSKISDDIAPQSTF